MGKHIHLDTVGGVAGDMFVAAMMDAFPQLQQACWQDIKDAGLLQHVNVELTQGMTNGLVAMQFQVSLRETQAKRTGRYASLRQWLNNSDLVPNVRSRALSILQLLASAEAHVHGVELDDVHFHEIADWDSMVDVVAAASMIEHSAIESWSCSVLPTGSGLVKTEHGALPLPAPATLQLLKGFRVWDDGDSGERVTPTGAAILKHLFTQQDGQLKPMHQRMDGTVAAVGNGAGQRILPSRPNLLRVVVSELDERHADSYELRDDILEMRCDIDDMTPEEMAVSLEHIRDCTGVVDACFQLGIGKKGRAVFHVVVMSLPAYESAVSACLFQETTTLGMRVCTIRRRLLKREMQVVADESGVANVKIAARFGSSTGKVESDDLAKQPGLQARRKRANRLLAKLDS